MAGQLLRISAVARRLDIHPSTVRAWITAGRLPVIRYPSGHLRVSAGVIEDILAGARTQNTSSDRTAV